MYIKSVILDGFKSYGKRTEIHGFDSEFTAITGLNGTGKSNVLDSICFVLGISNLGQVRATSLQELVYKSGQAGIKKATVTIVFDNTDQNQCPLGYEKCREISVTRQVIVGGKNKYLINGKNVLNKKVADLFCSVKLNVNNPNFLIMQGRITKVLNMKPFEILSMVEEAAGTSMYESKRDQTNKLIEKKDSKLKEIETLLKEEIEPKLEKLRTERTQYIEFQKIVRDIEYLTRIYISHKYLQYKKSVENCEKSLTSLANVIDENKNKIKFNEQEAIKIDENIRGIQQEIDNNSGGKLDELEKELMKKSKEEATSIGAKKSAVSGLETEKRKLKALEKNISDDEQFLVTKENKMSKVSGLFKSLKETDEADSKAYVEAQKRYEAVSSGLSATNEKGEATSLQDELIKAKKQMSEASTTIKQSEMELKHTTSVLKSKQGQLQSNDAAYLKDKKAADQFEIEITNLQANLSKINYEDGTLERLENEKVNLTQRRRQIKQQLDRQNAYRYEFQYRDPEPNFNRRRVKGMVCNLFDVINPMDSLALSMCAGGSLYNVVTDTDSTAKLILQKGQLQTRTTLIPINKISTNCIHPNVIKIAQDLVGKENVAPALSLISYQDDVDKVMKYVFGRTFICKDINIAKKVTYDRRIMCRSVTLEGDVVDPEGTLSGGSRPKGTPILIEVAEIKNLIQSLNDTDVLLNEISTRIDQSQQIARKYTEVKEQLGLRQHELESVQQRLAQTSYHQHKQEIEELKEKIEKLKSSVKNAADLYKTSAARAKDIDSQLADSKGNWERQLKASLEEMKVLKKKSEESQKNWKKREQEYETLQMEIEELNKGIKKAKQQAEDMANIIRTLEEQLIELTDTSKNVTTTVNALKAQVKQQKDLINSQNKEVKHMYALKDKMVKDNQDFQLDIKKKENEISKLKAENNDGFQSINRLEDKYKWIQEDKQYFGVKNTRYDYSKEDPKDAEKKLNVARASKEKMEKHINLKAMMLLEREEEQYEEVKKRKVIVLDDKQKIQKIIEDLDEKKKQEVKKAWHSVDKNFGEIFSTLLPGAQACLVPPDGRNFLLGLSVRVGFNGVWKESLNELSGGQRSLVALSLILAMLKFKPAPLYILDEVDAALDMSHTQNIGNMLKAHFTNSQFIIVSLKDGMFNNANVLFKTKFEDGVSGITRTVNVRSQK